MFGSVARGEDRPDSDVDLLADLPSGMGLLGLGRVQAELEAILGSRVDLIPARDLKPGVGARAEQDLVSLQATVDNDLPELERAIEALLDALPDADSPGQACVP